MSLKDLPFEDRQKQWVGERREFRQHHGRQGVRVWEIWISDGRVFTRHGLLGGAMQETSYVGKAKNVGRANAITAEQDALAEARRDIRKKWDFEGYDEYFDGVNVDRRNQDISISALVTNLPGSFCLFKPENNLYDQKRLLKKANEGQVWYTLKRDGMAKLVTVDYYNNVVIYSRRSRPYHDKEGPKELADGTLDWSTVIPWSARFPHLVEAVKALGLPPGSMIAGELVFPGNGPDEFKYVASLTKSYTQKALEDMQSKGAPHLYVWDIPFLGGEDLASTMPVGKRIHLFRDFWERAQQPNRDWLIPLSVFTFPNPDAAVEKAKEMEIEGWVVVDPESTYGDKAWNLKGKPDRPKTCAKLKPSFEDDFVALWDPDNGVGAWGTGRHEKGKRVTLPNGEEVTHGGVGSVALYQYNLSGELIYICDCASGMSYEFQSQQKKESFPQVWQVEYKERTYISDGEKTNALRFPTFLRSRRDKQPGECVNDRL